MSDPVNIFMYLILSLIRHFILKMINRIVQTNANKKKQIIEAIITSSGSDHIAVGID